MLKWGTTRYQSHHTGKVKSLFGSRKGISAHKSHLAPKAPSHKGKLLEYDTIGLWREPREQGVETGP